MKPCDHDSFPQYKALIGPLREMAQCLGYAIGVHGTLKRDIDLIACPWARDAVGPIALAYCLRAVAAAVCGYAFHKPTEQGEFFQAGCPGKKPHGRLCWSFYLGGPSYIDLSVMPKGPEPEMPVDFEALSLPMYPDQAIA